MNSDRHINSETTIQERLEHLAGMIGGYSFAQLISVYWKASDIE